jgi:hypothetical protein
MKAYYEEVILSATGAQALGQQKLIQTLWSGYGEILKVELIGGSKASIILKYIDLPEEVTHPRGWNTSRSHERKIKSYDVEMNWYKEYSNMCDNNCRIAQNIVSASAEGSHLIVLEDLDLSGYPKREHHLNPTGVKACLKWLAHFHATFMGVKPDGLWSTGTYWHLDTRPDELQEMAHGPLKTHAAEIDRKLTACQYQTFVHGDAKVANFCFSNDRSSVAAVDFQYVGGGCGMKDVVYFLGSCLDEYECQQKEEEYLDFYFNELKQALADKNSSVNIQDVENEWRQLYSWAWTDFYRFLLGWMPGHHKIHSYTKSLSQRVLSQLNVQ